MRFMYKYTLIYIIISGLNTLCDASKCFTYLICAQMLF